MRKNDLVAILKEKLPRMSEEGLTAWLVDEDPFEAKRFLKDMRRKLRLADDKRVIICRNENRILYISHSIERVLRDIERDKDIERDIDLSFEIEDIVEMIEGIATHITEDEASYPYSFLEIRFNDRKIEKNS